MLDSYIYGKVERISPEAPVPVLSRTHAHESLGAVGNVARNVSSLGGQAMVIALIGDDDAAHRVTGLLARDASVRADLITDPGRRTTVKLRAMAGGQQLLRIDDETPWPASGSVARELLEAALAEVEEADALAIADYAKGALPASVLSPLIERARELELPIVVDPKGRDFGRYRGATLVKPNARELAYVAGRDVTSIIEADAAAQEVMEDCGLEAILVTLSEKGMVLCRRDAQPVSVPAQALEVFDVSGAGDTGLAATALVLAGGGDLVRAAQVANAACGVAVTKSGAATVSAEETLQALRLMHMQAKNAKIVTQDKADEIITRWRHQGLTIGFTNGCFDILHAGHVALLRQAREACDRLVIGLNDDASVTRLKGEGRPVNSETTRAAVLASLQDVDLLTVFSEDTPLDLIERLKPDVLIKGRDYAKDDVVGARETEERGGRVVLAELETGYSTTSVIEKILQ
jgi:D-beta-D-heptose 7-phosphate kinase/D-beta-D-heptose 1-phosphate adenosyltransferase